jgi:hypothetical protein
VINIEVRGEERSKESDGKVDMSKLILRNEEPRERERKRKKMRKN